MTLSLHYFTDIGEEEEENKKSDWTGWLIFYFKNSFHFVNNTSCYVKLPQNCRSICLQIYATKISRPQILYEKSNKPLDIFCILFSNTL
jgi:hypothetical protein